MSDKNDITKDSTVGVSLSKTMENFSHDELYAAMRDAVDLMDGLHLPGFLLGNTARHSWDNTEMNGNEITFGIKKAEYSDVVKSIVRALRPQAVVEEDNFSYMVGKVPVRVKVIKRNYAFFQNLDRKWYHYDEYLFANPFENYWKARYIVQ